MLTKSTSIQLNEHWQQFIAERIEAGRFDSVSEALREGLRVLEERERRIDELNAALAVGEASGDAGPLDMNEIISEARAAYQRAA